MHHKPTIHTCLLQSSNKFLLLNGSWRELQYLGSSHQSHMECSALFYINSEKWILHPLGLFTYTVGEKAYTQVIFCQEKPQSYKSLTMFVPPEF